MLSNFFKLCTDFQALIKIHSQNLYKLKVHSFVCLRSLSSQLYAGTGPCREHVEKVHGCVKITSFLMLHVIDTNKFSESLNWCQMMVKCWHSSACNATWFQTSASGQQLFASYRKEKNSYKMSKIFTKAVVHRVSYLTLHCGLHAIVVYLYLTKILNVLHSLLPGAVYLFLLEL